MKKNKYLPAIIVGIASGLTSVLVLHFNLPVWLSILLIAIIVYFVARIVERVFPK